MAEKTVSFLWRAFLIWLVIILAESIHGILRTIFLEPFVGDFRARQIAVFTGALFILIIAFVSIRYIRAANQRQLIAVGFLWLVLTVGFEIVLGRAVMKVSWERILSDYDIAAGGLLPFGLIVLTLAPLIVSALRKKLQDYATNSQREN